jgi:hypothetical protein
VIFYNPSKKIAEVRINLNKLLIKFFISIGAIIVLGIHAKAQIYVGYVLEIRGNWYLNGNSSDTLQQRRKLPASSVIRIQSPNRDDLITVVDMGGKIYDSRDCAVNCSRSIRLPAAPAQPTILGGLWQAAMDLLSGAPNRYSAHRSRGGEISEGVVKFTDGKIDLSPVLNIQGQNYLRWRAVPPDEKAEPGAWSETIESGKIVPFSEFKPGLYEFNVLRKIGSAYEPVSSAWILVSSAEDYEKTKKSYEQAIELTGQWEGKVKPKTAQSFLKAYLDELARKNLRQK